MEPRKTLNSKNEYGVAWIAALDIERAAAIALLDERHGPPEDFEQSPRDSNSYAWGSISKHNVVIASLDGKLVASASYDKTIKIWDAATRMLRQTIATTSDVFIYQFHESLTHIETSQGDLELDPDIAAIADVSAVREVKLLRRKYRIQKGWITRNERKLVWLPWDCRGQLDYYQERLVIGTPFGRLIWLEFFIEDLDRWG